MEPYLQDLIQIKTHKRHEYLEKEIKELEIVNEKKIKQFWAFIFSPIVIVSFIIF